MYWNKKGKICTMFCTSWKISRFEEFKQKQSENGILVCYFVGFSKK